MTSVSGARYDSWAAIWQMSFANRPDPPPTELPSASCALCYPAIARVALTGRADVPSTKGTIERGKP